MKEQNDPAILLLSDYMVNGICQVAIISDILSTCKQYSRPMVIAVRSVNQHFQSACYPRALE